MSTKYCAVFPAGSKGSISMADIEKQLDAMRRCADERNFVPMDVRRKKLRYFRKMIICHRDVIIKALEKDLGKHPFETLSAEVMPLLDVLKLLIKKMPSLLRPKRLSVNPMNFPASGRLVPEPYGMTLAIATWNYPLLLALEPVLGSYAAGNRAVLKLSNRSGETMKLIRYLVEKCFSDDEIIVIDDELSFEAVLSRRFDHIFFTGSAATGRLVLRHAAENFTPVILEMGGKSPCIVDKTADLKRAAKRIAWGKFSNAGQTCVAPDHLLVHESVYHKFMLELTDAVAGLYGNVPLESSDLAGIVDQQAYERLSELASHGRLVCGGEKDPAARKISPTVIDHLPETDALWQEEIFGPVMPVRSFSEPSEIFHTLSINEKPLALYYFGKDRKLMRRLQNGSSSGALVFNDVVTHFMNMDFPFGGVGHSGMGAYHGKRTLTAFVHFKPVMKRSAFWDFSLRYPPYDKFRLWFVKLLTGK